MRYKINLSYNAIYVFLFNKDNDNTGGDNDNNDNSNNNKDNYNKDNASKNTITKTMPANTQQQKHNNKDNGSKDNNSKDTMQYWLRFKIKPNLCFPTTQLGGSLLTGHVTAYPRPQTLSFIYSLCLKISEWNYNNAIHLLTGNVLWASLLLDRCLAFEQSPDIRRLI